MEAHLSHMQWCGMAVVQAYTTEVFGCYLCVLLHVLPQIGTVVRFITIAELHAVTPADQLSL